MGPDRGAFRTRRTLALTALHLRAHPRVHLLQRDVADSLLRHDELHLLVFGGVYSAAWITILRGSASCALAQSTVALYSVMVSLASMPQTRRANLANGPAP